MCSSPTKVAYIYLDGYIDRQSTPLHGFDRSDVIVQIKLHSIRVTVWHFVSDHGLFGPYIIQDAEDRYKDIVIRPHMQNLRRFCCAEALYINRQLTDGRQVISLENL